jgi:hypothetical protein
VKVVEDGMTMGGYAECCLPHLDPPRFRNAAGVFTQPDYIGFAMIRHDLLSPSFLHPSLVLTVALGSDRCALPAQVNELR